MFLRAHQRSKDGKDHTYWSLVETVCTADGPRQRTLCYLGELNGSASVRVQNRSAPRDNKECVGVGRRQCARSRPATSSGVLCRPCGRGAFAGTRWQSVTVAKRKQGSRFSLQPFF